ncbi:MAG: hypothetical protein U9R26_10035 [Campylobacterota bacterium]|nr:hypothetical protein [Campylobacterota bacterium]
MEPIILEIKAFFFNAQTDYLPYYRQFSFKLTEEMKSKDLLALIKEQNKDFSYPRENLVFRINDLVVDGDTSMNEVVEKLGTSLQIDPVDSYRSTNGLIINDTDFMKSYELLAPFASEDDLKYYQNLYALHYASETFRFDHDYIGDAILLLAHKMIQDGSEHKEEILAAIDNPFNGLSGCEYENNLFDACEHTAAIDELKAMTTAGDTNLFVNKIAQLLPKKPVKRADVRSVEGMHVAFYAGSDTSREKLKEVNAQIRDAGAFIVNFDRSAKLAGRSLLERQKELAYTKAGTTLLNALDSGAELLIVANTMDLQMFEEHHAAIVKQIGRDIPLALISYEDFVNLEEKAAS